MEDLGSNIIISTRNIKLTPAIENYIKKRLKFLQRFGKYIDKINIEVTDKKAESESLKYEITINVKKDVLRVEETGNDLYSMVDLAHDILKLKIERYKDKMTDHDQSTESMVEQEEAAILDEVEKDSIVFEDEPIYTPKIYKRKTYSDNRPLTPNEAIEQMEMLNHKCFLFKNLESNKYAMIYKRSDGKYALVEPENI